MSTERRCLVIVALACVATIISGLIRATILICGERPIDALPWCMAVVLAYWVGSAVVDVLRENPNL